MDRALRKSGALNNYALITIFTNPPVRTDNDLVCAVILGTKECISKLKQERTGFRFIQSAISSHLHQGVPLTDLHDFDCMCRTYNVKSQGTASIHTPQIWYTSTSQELYMKS